MAIERKMRWDRSYGLVVLAITVAMGLVPLQGQAQSASSRGKEFWLGFMENADNSAMMLKVMISGEQATAGTISSPLSGYSQSFTVSAGSTTEVTVPNSFIHFGSEQPEGLGLLIVTDDTVSVCATVFSIGNSAAALVLPLQALGSRYLVHAYSGFPELDQYPSELLIVATADDTHIEITSRAPTVGGQIPFVPFQITLDRGGSYQIKANSASVDLTGTLVEGLPQSDPCKPFAVFSGSVCPQVPAGCYACDHVFQQNPPTAFWGTSYHLLPLPNALFTYRILSDTGADITVNGGAPITMAAGPLEVNNVMGPVCITGNAPFSVAQFMQGGDCSGAFIGDPEMVILHADDQEIREARFKTPYSAITLDERIHIIVDPQDTATVEVDGATLAGALFHAYPACNDKYYASVAIGPGEHHVVCANGMLAYATGMGNGYESYAFSLGATFADSLLCIALSTPADPIPPSSMQLSNDPATGMFALLTTAPTGALIEVRDVRGALVYTTRASGRTTPVDLRNVSMGLYVLRVAGTSLKVIVER